MNLSVRYIYMKKKTKNEFIDANTFTNLGVVENASLTACKVWHHRFSLSMVPLNGVVIFYWCMLHTAPLVHIWSYEIIRIQLCSAAGERDDHCQA